MSQSFVVSKRRKQLIIWVLLLVMPIVGMAVDLICPSLPSIAINLNISSSYVKNIVSAYLFGYAIGNFFIGFLTDLIGRKIIIRLALFSFVLISLIPVFLPNIHLLLLTRIIQGITLGGVTVTSRAVFSDLLTPAELTPMGVIIGSMFGLGPVLGPWVGGYLQTYFGWQSCFVFFAVVILIEFILIFFLVPETHYNRQQFNIKIIANNCKQVIMHKKFLALIIIMGSAYSMIIAFNTVGPFLIQNKLHYSPLFFGRIALFLGIIYLIATFICKMLLTKFTPERLFGFFINLFAILSLITLILSYFWNNNLIIIIASSAIMFFATGFLYPLGLGNGLSLFRHIAGTAAAIMVFLNVLMTGIVGAILSFIEIEDATFLMWVNLTLTLIAVFTYWLGIYSNKSKTDA